MRKFLFSVLLASAATTPALAQPSDHDRQQAREEREQAREERQQARHESRQESRDNRADFVRQDRAEPPAEQRQVSETAARTRGRDRGDVNMELQRQRIDERQQAAELRRDSRVQQQAQYRAEHPVVRTRVPVVSNTPRPGTQPPAPTQYRPSPAPTWSTNWRNNSKYDWHNHRHHHRSLFHLGFYYDPFGWNYSPFQVGWRMWPSYYSSRYWINDPWMYRLPYAPPGYRWIRYWDDAVLVDTWSGQVVDVIYNFFW